MHWVAPLVQALVQQDAVPAPPVQAPLVHIDDDCS